MVKKFSKLTTFECRHFDPRTRSCKMSLARFDLLCCQPPPNNVKNTRNGNSVFEVPSRIEGAGGSDPKSTW